MEEKVHELLKEVHKEIVKGEESKHPLLRFQKEIDDMFWEARGSRGYRVGSAEEEISYRKKLLKNLISRGLLARIRKELDPLYQHLLLVSILSDVVVPREVAEHSMLKSRKEIVERLVRNDYTKDYRGYVEMGALYSLDRQLREISNWSLSPSEKIELLHYISHSVKEKGNELMKAMYERSYILNEEEAKKELEEMVNLYRTLYSYITTVESELPPEVGTHVEAMNNILQMFKLYNRTRREGDTLGKKALSSVAKRYADMFVKYLDGIADIKRRSEMYNLLREITQNASGI